MALTNDGNTAYVMLPWYLYALDVCYLRDHENSFELHNQLIHSLIN